MTIGDLVTSAFIEIRSTRSGDVLDADKMARGVYLLNRLLDFWNANGRAIYAEGFADYTTTPSLSPHTIGPGGTFNVTQRPIEVDAVALAIGGGLYSPPLNKREYRWYAALAAPGITSPLPTDFYYQPDYPLGKLYLWAVPSTAIGIRVWTNTQLLAVVQTDDFALPQGYQQAIELTLAEMLAPGYGQTVSRETEQAARQARALVFSNNDDMPRIAASDSGLARPKGGTFASWELGPFSR
jgi:hypothetical protein